MGYARVKSYVSLSFFIIILASLLLLSTWQIFRYFEKIKANDHFEDTVSKLYIDEIPTDILQNTGARAHGWDNKLIEISGRFDHSGEQFIFTTLNNGAPGYLLITPFMAHNATILVERGKIPTDKKQNIVVPPENIYRPNGDTTIQGHFYWPKQQKYLIPENDLENKVWFTYNIEEMARITKSSPLLFQELAIKVELTSKITGENKLYDDLLVPKAKILKDNYNYKKHIYYAITWLSLAFFWVLIIRNAFHSKN